MKVGEYKCDQRNRIPRYKCNFLRIYVTNFELKKSSKLSDRQCGLSIEKFEEITASMGFLKEQRSVRVTLGLTDFGVAFFLSPAWFL